jgi:N-acetylmuramoyl-L-alanine amidase
MMMEVPQYTQTIEIAYEDAQALMKVAQAEAGNQGIDGMALVMQTVLNRVESDDYPDTVYDVIAQKGQFATYKNGAYSKAVPSADCHLALAEVEKGTFSNQTVIAFEVTGSRSLEKYFSYAFTLGDHDFYTEKID